MGNKDSKENITNECTLKNQTVYKSMCSNKGELSRADIERKWLTIIDKELCTLVIDYLFDTKILKFEDYDEFSTVILKGTYNEKAKLLLQIVSSIGQRKEGSLDQFLSAVLLNFIQIEKSSNVIKLWAGSEVFVKKEDFRRSITYMLQLAGSSGGDNKVAFSVQDICSLLVVFDRFLTGVFSCLLGHDMALNPCLPQWQRLVGDFGKSLAHCSVLQLEDVMLLNTQLPIDWQMEWRLLFSTKIHGESFSRLVGQIVNQGPTILIIKDSDNYTFGAFAPANWSLSPIFSGDSTSFLFTLTPEINIYFATNFNENFQYMNQGQQTLPNGLGMGGRLEYFGLWLDSEFGKGISNDSCTTYRNFSRLSKQKDFTCAEVEVWGVGSPPPTAADLGERSILDGNTEAKAILEMAGRKTYSDGLREQPEDT